MSDPDSDYSIPDAVLEVFSQQGSLEDFIETKFDEAELSAEKEEDIVSPTTPVTQAHLDQQSSDQKQDRSLSPDISANPPFTTWHSDSLLSDIPAASSDSDSNPVFAIQNLSLVMICSCLCKYFDHVDALFIDWTVFQTPSLKTFCKNLLQGTYDVCNFVISIAQWPISSIFLWI